MARYLSLDHTEELMKKGYVLITRGQNGILLPQIRFKTSPFPFCPFLINDLTEDGTLRGLCSLHPHHKPLVCSLAPLGRVYDFDKPLTKRAEYTYIRPTPECTGCEKGAPLPLADMEESLKSEIIYEEEFYRLLWSGYTPTEEFYSFSVKETFSLSDLTA